MNEKELAKSINKEIQQAKQELKDFLGLRLSLNDKKLKDINITLLIEELKKLGLNAELENNVNWAKQVKNSNETLLIY